MCGHMTLAGHPEPRHMYFLNFRREGSVGITAQKPGQTGDRAGEEDGSALRANCPGEVSSVSERVGVRAGSHLLLLTEPWSLVQGYVHKAVLLCSAHCPREATSSQRSAFCDVPRVHPRLAEVLRLRSLCSPPPGTSDLQKRTEKGHTERPRWRARVPTPAGSLCSRSGTHLCVCFSGGLAIRHSSSSKITSFCLH
jgi:hypothetical protein